MTSSLQFTETMKGFVTPGADDPQNGYETGRAKGDSLAFELTIRTEDIDLFVSSPAHQAAATGWIEGDIVGGRCAVDDGIFNLFVGDEPQQRRMLYHLPFVTGAGESLVLNGFKDVRDDPLWDVWRDTSTLYTTIDRPDGTTTAAGILTIHVPDFLVQLTTFRASGPSATSGVVAMEKFGRLFLGQLWEVYGRRLHPGKAS